MALDRSYQFWLGSWQPILAFVIFSYSTNARSIFLSYVRRELKYSLTNRILIERTWKVSRCAYGKLKRKPKFIQNLDLKICILDPSYVILKNCNLIIVIDLKRHVIIDDEVNFEINFTKFLSIFKFSFKFRIFDTQLYGRGWYLGIDHDHWWTTYLGTYPRN